MSDLDYSQQRSLNVGIAIDTDSVGAAIIYDDLAYAQRVFGNGYFYRSYEQLMKRFPMWSERTIRNYIKILEKQGWIETKIMKVNGAPVCHYKICRYLTAKFADTKESDKFADSIYKETKKETKTSADAQIQQLLSLVNRVTQREFRTLPRGSKKTLNLFSLAEIETALRALAVDDWHEPKLKELSSDYLLRATTIDKFLGVAKEQGIKPEMSNAEKDADIASRPEPEPLPGWDMPDETK